LNGSFQSVTGCAYPTLTGILVAMIRENVTVLPVHDVVLQIASIRIRAFGQRQPKGRLDRLAILRLRIREELSQNFSDVPVCLLFDTFEIDGDLDSVNVPY
jgi:hypothetical protein